MFGGKKKPYCRYCQTILHCISEHLHWSLKGWHVEYLTPLFGIKEFIYHSHWSRYYCSVDLIHIYDPPLRLMKERNNATTQLSPCHAGCKVQNLIHVVVIQRIGLLKWPNFWLSAIVCPFAPLPLLILEDIYLKVTCFNTCM